MRLQQGQAVALWDGQDHCLGEIAVDLTILDGEIVYRADRWSATSDSIS